MLKDEISLIAIAVVELAPLDGKLGSYRNDQWKHKYTSHWAPACRPGKIFSCFYIHQDRKVILQETKLLPYYDLLLFL